MYISCIFHVYFMLFCIIFCVGYAKISRRKGSFQWNMGLTHCLLFFSGSPYGPPMGPPPGVMAYGPGGVVTMQPRMCGPQYGGGGPYARPPSTYMLCHILNFLFCCWPIAICGLLQACATQNAIQRGDMEDAYIHSRQSRCLAISAGIFVAVQFVVGIVVVIVLVLTSGSI